MCAKRSLEALLKRCNFAEWPGHDNILKNISVTNVMEGNILAEFRVTKETLNFSKGLHGGFIASVMDTFNTIAVMSKSETGQPGVTVDLHVSYMKGAKEGDEVLVNARTVRVGRKVAYTECELKHKADGSLIARSTQTQYIGN